MLLTLEVVQGDWGFWCTSSFNKNHKLKFLKSENKNLKLKMLLTLEVVQSDWCNTWL